MKFLKSLAVSLPLFAAWPAMAEELSVQIVMDNGFGLQNPGQAETIRDALFHAVYNASANYKFKNAQIDIVTTATADQNDVPRTVWSGKLSDLSSQYEVVKSAVSHVPNGCTDLERAFDEVRRNIIRSPAKRIWILSVSSLIHLGRPCDSLEIKLPQPVPQKINLGGFVADNRVERIWFLAAEGDQRNVWLDALIGVGAPLRMNEGTLDFTTANLDESLNKLASAEFRKEIRK